MFRLFRDGLQTSIVNNASAYGYSVAITLSYSATTNSLGKPAAAELLLFAVGAAVGFAVTEMVAVGRLRGEVRTEPNDVVVLGGGLAVVSVTATIAVALGVSQFVRGWVGWPVTAFASTCSYVLRRPRRWPSRGRGKSGETTLLNSQAMKKASLTAAAQSD